MMQRIAILLAVGSVFLRSQTSAFIPQRSSAIISPSTTDASLCTPLFMAGFGGGGGSSSSKKKSKKTNKATTKKPSNKLKPRKQWDRFIDLKAADPVRVAVQTTNGDDESSKKWYEIGEVKSKDNEFTEAAVIRHRLLIAEHARRMFPVQILAKDTLEWGYSTTEAAAVVADDDTVATTTTTADTTNWTVVTSAPANTPDGVDKLIGFRGHPDPFGFYSSSQKGLKAGDTHAMSQTGYLGMKGKGITGLTALEIHD